MRRSQTCRNPLQLTHLREQISAAKDVRASQLHHQTLSPLFLVCNVSHEADMEGMAGQRSSRLLACARKCSTKHMVRACSTNQPVLRLSMGSLALITSTSWAPGCPSELLGQGGWVGGQTAGSVRGKTGEYKENNKRWIPCFCPDKDG